MNKDSNCKNFTLINGFRDWSEKSIEALIEANENADRLSESELKQNIKRALEEAISYTSEIFAYSVEHKWEIQDSTVIYEHGSDGFKKLKEKYNVEPKTLSFVDDILNMVKEIKELMQDSDHCYVKTRLYELIEPNLKKDFAFKKMDSTLEKFRCKKIPWDVFLIEISKEITSLENRYLERKKHIDEFGFEHKINL